MSRDYQFNVGPETATLPTATDPTVDADLMTKGYADDNYFPSLTTQTQFTVANNQSSAASITSLIFSETSYRSAMVLYTVERRTNTQSYRQTGMLVCHYNHATSLWSVENIVWSGSSGLDTGITFSIDTSTGQLKYATDNMSGTGYVGKLSWKTLNAFPKET